MEKLLEVKNLVVSYFTYAGEVQSVRNVSFDIEKGKTTAIVGESGCGKTVTAKTLMGLIHKPGKIKEGSQIIFEGKDLTDFTTKEWNEYRGKKSTMIFQDALVSLNPTMKIGKQIMENLDNHEKTLSKEEKEKRAVEILEMVEIPDAKNCLKKYPHELSGGMRQRVMIAIALVTHPQLLIADEPTTALDVTIQAQIVELMKRLQDKMGMSIILITHDLGIVANFATDIIVMYAGKIVERGSAYDIFYHPSHPYTEALLRAVPRLDMEGEELETIEGAPPNMANPPKGCPFANRCKFCQDICKKEFPEEISVGEGHEVCCWLRKEEQ